VEQNQKYWLLRIEQTIYGPFDTQKVVDLITKGRVSEIDEAALPRDRWFFVRDLQEFMRAVELQRKINSRKRVHEETKGSETSTEALDSEQIDDQTRELTSLDNLTSTLPTPNITREELLAIGDVKRARPLLSDSQNTNKTGLNKKSIFTILGLFFICILGFLFKDKLLNSFQQGRSALITENPMESWNNSDFATSYDIFKRNSSLQEKKPLEYAALILKNTKDYSLAKTWLDKASPVEKESNAWINLNAVVYLYENNIDEAEKFIKSIDQSKGELSLESLYNLAVWHHKQKDWSQSRTLFESVFAQQQSGELDGAVLYMADSWLQNLVIKNASQSEYLKLSEFINNVRNSESLYRYDISFLAFWLIQNNKVSASVFSGLEDEFMSYDPQMAFNRAQSPFIYDFFGTRIKDYCTTLVSSTKYIQLSCQMLALRGSLNSVVLPERPVGDVNLLALYSFIYDKRGDSFKANEFLIESFEKSNTSRDPIRYYVQARFCQVNGNFKCAAENWKKSLKLNEFSPTALVGLSQAYVDIDDIEKAKTLFDKSTPFSKNLVSYKKLSHRMKALKKKG